jgi:hypothetical protein
LVIQSESLEGIDYFRDKIPDAAAIEPPAAVLIIGDNIADSMNYNFLSGAFKTGMIVLVGSVDAPALRAKNVGVRSMACAMGALSEVKLSSERQTADLGERNGRNELFGFWFGIYRRRISCYLDHLIPKVHCRHYEKSQLVFQQVFWATKS